ncbi:hypothetical protein [Streptomyces liangshanensis]|uniref:hypothetical protein n=1 Tax=Streptomyces liangshanensis TaxID=2717324 RepID=UPI0036DE36F8
MTTSETSRFVRLRVELVLEIDGPEALSAAALGRIVADETMREDERAHARATVREEPAEALAYLVEPYDLVRDVPGVELAQASWTSEEIDYDPDAVEWALDEDDEAEGYDDGDDGDDDREDDRDDEAGDEGGEGGGDGPVGGDGPGGFLGDDGTAGGRGSRFDHRDGQGPR